MLCLFCINSGSKPSDGAPWGESEPLTLPLAVLCRAACSAVRFHYQYNLRELSAVCAGLCRMTPARFQDPLKVGADCGQGRSRRRWYCGREEPAVGYCNNHPGDASIKERQLAPERCWDCVRAPCVHKHPSATQRHRSRENSPPPPARAPAYPLQVVRLWVHECERVMGDRLVSEADGARFAEFRGQVTRKHFEDLPLVGGRWEGDGGQAADTVL